MQAVKTTLGPKKISETTTKTATTTASVDSATTIILVDSINNNSNSQSNVNTNVTGRPATAVTRMTVASCSTTPTATYVEIPLTLTNENGYRIDENVIGEIIELDDKATTESVAPTQKKRSLLNFKSLDFNLKSIYSGLRSKHTQSQSTSLGENTSGTNVNNSSITNGATTTNTNTCRRAATIHNRMPPCLKIESVDLEESENLLLDYPQSPYSSRRNSSPQDNNRSSSQLLHIDRYERTRSQATSPSPSPYFLSPYVTESGNIRRSSTSDITSCKRSGTSSTSDSRRPSTSDLLRKARERKGSEARMGRSVSHSGLPRGGRGGYGGGGGGRRTSIAF